MKETDKKTKDLPRNISLLERVTPLAQQINCLDIKKIAEICVNQIPTLIGARFASLYILDETNTILHLEKCNHPFALNKIVSLNQTPPTPMIMAVHSKELILVGNINNHKRPVIQKSQRTFVENYKTNNCIIAPLICQNMVVGILNLADITEVDDFDHENIALIELFRELVGASIGNIKLFLEMQHQATTDGLTGLMNHKTFYETLEKELWRSRRYGSKISLIMVDIDNLKAINDTFGHRAGDKVIREISKKIKECVRQIDTAARYGGDEFAIILPNTDLEDTVFVAERIVKTVSNSTILWENKRIKPSVSIGLGQCNGNVSPDDITILSDQALYTAKQAGKNTVRILENSKMVI